MLATTPPTENATLARAAVLDLARGKLARLFPDAAELDALPAWLWSLPTHTIARTLLRDACLAAQELAHKLDAETDRRHPAERFVAYLDAHHPLLSHGQRARTADYAQAIVDIHERRGVVEQADLVQRGFTLPEIERLHSRALKLIAAVGASAADAASRTETVADRLRAAGQRAHARRAFAEGDLEFDAAAAARVPAAAQVAR